MHILEGVQLTLSRDDGQVCGGCRFADHPFVAGPPHLRFMAAAPLMDASGQRVGCL